MDIATINVEKRAASGRNQVLRLREQGKVPGILYGFGRDNMPVAVTEADLARHLREHHRVFKLVLDDLEQPTFLKDIQFDTMTDRPVHVDFLRIDLEKKLELEVEINYVGHPKGLSRGGVLIKDVSDLQVASLPTAIPDNFEIQIGGLDIGDSITAADVPLATGVSLLVPPETVLCHVTEKAAEAPAEGEEAAEGAEGAEAPGGGETPGES